jgi:5-methylcytosine-specific restriction protein B
MMDFKEEFEQRILNLQLHQNYSYEDFIVGMKIVNNETKWEKGYLLKLIDKINEENADNKKNKELPYILILDEINRVDLSRLFGELFSAIENRDETVKLSAIDESNKEFLGLKVPENLYIIGTMNQIDFSLERIDFALRRRFVWYFYGYNENRLREIIDFKCVKSETKIEIKPEHIDELVRRASAINESLEKDEDFGKEWEIGHTFFAEIVDILISLDKTKKNYMLYVKSQDGKLTTAKEPVNVLWHISIKPMLEAYCGNLDKKTKKDKLDKLANIFLKGTK